jgi:hypothetical protein
MDFGSQFQEHPTESRRLRDHNVFSFFAEAVP